ncbi:REJ domain protein (macronuclear) [Tetrahymena thermophila SB210]|uniref:REJ domain protein n=1 Tax=Tetrahymena thermophila (strain SB210) TaxID=312017 RepID=I7M4C3_TETTS|nr:REJ domain protein [Tetrahymena thermophila SB210]EAS06209.3 REJ domain protein [Tetrahymena thermophila SB210]|eukprot:XP_001026454.3 REJ domain protein [Tetrahymena thermophila SB210]
MQEFTNSSWDNLLDFAIYGWFKIQLVSNIWGVGFHFTSNPANHWNDKTYFGDRLLTFYTMGYTLENHSYTLYSDQNQNNSPNIWLDTTFSSDDVNKWAFIYVSVGSTEQKFQSFYKLPSSNPIFLKSTQIITHQTSSIYRIYLGYSISNYAYFPGQICGLYILAGKGAYRETGFEQFYSLQSSDAQSCGFCQPGYYLQSYSCYQWCPNNYKLNLVQKTCDQCSTYTSDCQTCATTCRSCQFGNKDICLDCYETMTLSSGTCVCKNGIDNRNIFYQCSNDNVAVLQANLASDSPILTINFGVTLKNNILGCSQIFQTQTLGQLGTNPICSISKTNITITLSQDANITETQQISFLPNILSYQNNNNLIDTFYLLSFTQLRNNPFQMNYKYDELQNTCNDITFQLIPQNDANRGFNSIIWSIQTQPTLDSQTSQQVDMIVQTANNNINSNLIIPKYLIPPDTKVTATVQYFMRVNINGTLSFSTMYKKYKQIVIQTIQSAYSPIYRYMDLSFLFQLYIQICDQSGSFQLYEPYDIQISSKALPILNQSFSQTTLQSFQVSVKKYQIPFNTAFDLQLSAVLDNNKTITQQTSVNINPALSKLFVQIISGQDGLFNYKKDLNLTGIVRDLEIQDSSAPQGISLSWLCQSLISQSNGDRQCLDFRNNTVTLAQNSLSTVIPASTFTPYQTLQFSFVGQKDTRTSYSNMTAIIAEIDIPPLFVSIQDLSQLQQVNLNEDIFVTLQYGSNVSSDVITYAGAVLYNNIEVGFIKFDFYQVKFRIWDYFISVTQDNPVVQVRFTAYNPSYYMPSMTVKSFNINLPPANCLFTVSPTSGQALQTIFTLQMSGCTSSDNVLTYQFFYYQNNSEFKQEILIPNNILRRQIQDQSLINLMNTTLPSGNLTIMGQVMNSKLSVFNSTVQVKVDPFDQGEEQINNIIDQTIQSVNNQFIKQIVVNLCLVGEEISKNYPLYNLNSVNQRKPLLISQIINSTISLPNQSYLSTFSNKVISQLQFSLISKQDSQQQGVLNYINNTLQNQIVLMQDTSNKLLNNNNIVIQNLVDSFKMLNSTTQSISYSLLPSQMNISDQICGFLTNITLPNTGGIQLEGNLIQLNCQQITEKNLYQYVQEFVEIQSNTTNIYSISYSTYSQNPYNQTPEFINYTQQLVKFQPNITISQNPVIIPQIQNVNNMSNRRLLSVSNGSLNQNSTYIYKFQNVSKSQNKLTCLQKQTNSWSSSKCQMVNNTQMNGFYCYCKDKTPTTITDDLEQIIQNKNLQTAFSSQGFNNISNFKYFYKYAIFWTLSCVTLLSISLFFIGQRLDRKYLDQQSHRISPLIDIDQNLINTQNNVEANLSNKDAKITSRDENIALNQQKQQHLFQQENFDSIQQIKQNLKIEQKNQKHPSYKSPYFSSHVNQQYQLEKQEVLKQDNEMQLIDLDQQVYSKNIQQDQDQVQNEEFQNKLHDQQAEKQQQIDTLSSQSNQLQQQYELQLQKLQNQIGALETTTKLGAQTFLSLNIQQNNYYTTQNNIQLIDNKQGSLASNFQINNNEIIQKQQFSKESQNIQSINNAFNEQNQQNLKNDNSLEKNQKNGQEDQKEKILQQKNINGNQFKLAKKSFFKKLIIFHDFFNIFYTYDPKISRAIRFNIFYLRIIHSLCLTTIFDDSYNLDQKWTRSQLRQQPNFIIFVDSRNRFYRNSNYDVSCKTKHSPIFQSRVKQICYFKLFTQVI